MKRIFGVLNLVAFVLLGIGVVNINREVDLESSIYRLNTIIRQKISGNSSASAIEYSKVNGNAVAQASAAVVPVYIYEEVPVYEGRGSRFQFLQNITTKTQVGSGTGFFITENGYLLTNKHVVSGESAYYTVSLSGNLEMPAQVVYRDPYYDLAVLKIEGDNYPVIDLGDSSKLRVGQGVSGIGNAFGEFEDSISSGNISGLNRSVLVSDKDGSVERMHGLIQTDAKLYPGDSGGPLLNSEGRAVGVNVASSVGDNVSFSIPINIAKQVIDKAQIN